MQKELMQFATKEEAFGWMEEEVDDPCVDNYRFAYEDDVKATATYDEMVAYGCCGSFDCNIIVGGRRAWIGCNYGH